MRAGGVSELSELWLSATRKEAFRPRGAEDGGGAKVAEVGASTRARTRATGEYSRMFAVTRVGPGGSAGAAGFPFDAAQDRPFGDAPDRHPPAYGSTGGL